MRHPPLIINWQNWNYQTECFAQIAFSLSVLTGRSVTVSYQFYWGPKSRQSRQGSFKGFIHKLYWAEWKTVSRVFRARGRLAVASGEVGKQDEWRLVWSESVWISRVCEWLILEGCVVQSSMWGSPNPVTSAEVGLDRGDRHFLFLAREDWRLITKGGNKWWHTSELTLEVEARWLSMTHRRVASRSWLAHWLLLSFEGGSLVTSL